MSDASLSLYERLTDGVGEDGVIEDAVIETHYCPVEDVYENRERRFVAFVGDHGAISVEIRIPYEMLEENGWRKESTP